MHSELEMAQNNLSIRYPKHMNTALIASASMILTSFFILSSLIILLFNADTPWKCNLNTTLEKNYNLLIFIAYVQKLDPRY